MKSFPHQSFWNIKRLCFIQYFILYTSWILNKTCLTLLLCSIPITETSSLLQAVPPQFLASVLSSSNCLFLDFSLSIQTTASCSSLQKPKPRSRLLHTEHHLRSN